MRIILGLLIMALGLHMVWKTGFYLDFFGRVSAAEKYLGLEGGSRLFYKLLGVLFCFIGMFVATNLIQNIIVDTVGPLFKSL